MAATLQAGTAGDILYFPVTLVNSDGTTQEMDYTTALTISFEVTDPKGNNVAYTSASIKSGTTGTIMVLVVQTMFPSAGVYALEVIATFAGGVISKSSVGSIKILKSLA
jgi:hypothetical protein